MSGEAKVASALKDSQAPTAYNRFWNALNKLTEVRPLSDDAKKKFEANKADAAFDKMKKNIKDLNEFISDLDDMCDKIKKSGGKLGQLPDLISYLKRRITIIDAVVGASDDAKQAASEVQARLTEWYKDAYSKCKKSRDEDPYSDQEFICLASIDRLFQSRNVYNTLGSQDGSFVRIVYEKWRHRLKDLILPF